jgi:hypothetical protein
LLVLHLADGVAHALAEFLIVFSLGGDALIEVMRTHGCLT